MKPIIITSLLFMFAINANAYAPTDDVIYVSYDDTTDKASIADIENAFRQNREGVDPTNMTFNPCVWIPYTNTAGHKIYGCAEWSSHLRLPNYTGLVTRVKAEVSKTTAIKIDSLVADIKIDPKIIPPTEKELAIMKETEAVKALSKVVVTNVSFEARGYMQ